MTPIRQKLLGKLGRSFGDKPPSWTTKRDLGRAESDPAFICNGLNLKSFQGGGDDWVQDIVNMLSYAVRSKPLAGLYSDPVPSNDRTKIRINARADVISFGTGAVAIRMIKSTLWAAEQRGKIAMPNNLRVGLSGNTVEIYV
jgi:hypothetical protein